MAKNSLGLVFHPFKTLRSLIREKDYSQILLILGFPAYILFGGVFVIWFLRRLIGGYFGVVLGIWGMPTKLSLLLTFFVTLGLFFYLGYWFWQVWKAKNSSK